MYHPALALIFLCEVDPKGSKGQIKAILDTVWFYTRILEQRRHLMLEDFEMTEIAVLVRF